VFHLCKHFFIYFSFHKKEKVLKFAAPFSACGATMWKNFLSYLQSHSLAKLQTCMDNKQVATTLYFVFLLTRFDKIPFHAWDHHAFGFILLFVFPKQKMVVIKFEPIYILSHCFHYLPIILVPSWII